MANELFSSYRAVEARREGEIDMIKEKLPAPASDVKVLICGPPPMVAAMKKATEGLGFTKARPVSKLEDQVFCF